MSKEQGPYKVVERKVPQGFRYNVVKGPTEVSKTWYQRSDADEYREALNAAYKEGQASRPPDIDGIME